jgi:DHA1 family multidrug resistance protein-like MFS transporter
MSARLRLALETDPAHIGNRVVLTMPLAIWSMLLNAFAMSLGFFMLIPLVSVYYTGSLGFSAAAVGLALAVRQFSQQGLMLLTGSVAERLGYRPVLAAGMVIRSIGFAAFVFADTLSLLLVASFIAALGGAFFEVSARALMAVIVPAEQRTTGFSLWALASNIGLAIGPLIGAMLIGFSFASVCVVAALIYIVGAFGTMLLIPPSTHASATASRPPSLIRTVGIVSRDRPFVLFSAIMCGYYILSQQLFITIPLESARLTGDESGLGLVYLVNSIVALALQFPLVRLTGRFFSPVTTIALGSAGVTLALAGIGLVNGFVAMLGCIAFMAAARCLIEPVLNTTIAGIASGAGSGLLASYFGFSALSLAIGGAGGQLLGGWLFDQSQRLDSPALPWIVLGTIGLVVTVLLAVFSRSSAARGMAT